MYNTWSHINELLSIKSRAWGNPSTRPFRNGSCSFGINHSFAFSWYQHLFRRNQIIPNYSFSAPPRQYSFITYASNIYCIYSFHLICHDHFTLPSQKSVLYYRNYNFPIDSFLFPFLFVLSIFWRWYHFLLFLPSHSFFSPHAKLNVGPPPNCATPRSMGSETGDVVPPESIT